MRYAPLAAFALAFAAAPSLAAGPYGAPDDSWISITGTVVEPTAESFLLEYGGGAVTVEMDDWEWNRYEEAYGLLEGDQVTVYGRVDDDLYELATIEAASVYVDSLNTYFYASPADEEDLALWVTSAPLVESEVVVRGTVTGVDVVSREFSVDTGKQKLTVDAATLGYNPLDDKGFQQIQKGDVVSVTGELDDGFLKDRVLRANSVLTLSDAGEGGSS